MVYIFNLFHVVTAVYNGSSCFYFENLQHCKLFLSMWSSLYYHFTKILKFAILVCGPDPKMCICINIVFNQEVFQISFPQFVWYAKYEPRCTDLVEKVCEINYYICKKYTAFL